MRCSDQVFFVNTLRSRISSSYMQSNILLHFSDPCSLLSSIKIPNKACLNSGMPMLTMLDEVQHHCFFKIDLWPGWTNQFDNTRVCRFQHSSEFSCATVVRTSDEWETRCLAMTGMSNQEHLLSGGRTVGLHLFSLQPVEMHRYWQAIWCEINAWNYIFSTTNYGWSSRSNRNKEHLKNLFLSYPINTSSGASLSYSSLSTVQSILRWTALTATYVVSASNYLIMITNMSTYLQ